MKLYHLKSKHICEKENGICKFVSQNLICQNCKNTIHHHLEDIELIPEGKPVGSACPFCGKINFWLKLNGRLNSLPLKVGG